MDYPTTILGWAWLIGVGGLGFIFTITLVVFVHELGHFLAARYFGVRVESFSIGFGRAIAGFTDRYGTFWKIGWLPLGGYVKFWGDDGVSSTPDHEKVDHASAEERAGSFHHKPLYQKAIIAVGGPVANFILAIVILTGLFLIYGDTVVTPQIGRVIKGTPADVAGLQVGDTVLSIDGNPVREFLDIQRTVSVSQSQRLVFRVSRGGQELDIPVTPRVIDLRKDPFGNKVRDTGIGIGQVDPRLVGSVAADSPAGAAGMKADDVIIGVNQKPVGSFEDIASALREATGPLKLNYVRMEVDEATKERTEKRIDVDLQPAAGIDMSADADSLVRQATGLAAAIPGVTKPDIVVTLGPIESLTKAVSAVRFIVVKTMTFIGELLTGNGDYQQLSGPIGIASVSGQMLVFFGIVPLINLAAVLSVSIGLLNLFPIPMLDGGHLLYYGIEAVRGRPLGERAQELGFRIGLVLVVSLMLFATWNDLTKFRFF